MIENLLFNKNMDLMQKELNAISLRNKVYANNIANIETPGFKRSDVVFEDELKKAIDQSGKITGFRTNEKHIPIGGTSDTEVEPSIVQDNFTSMRNDGNNVDIDREMALQAENTIKYSAVSQALNGEFLKIKSAIEGR